MFSMSRSAKSATVENVRQLWRVIPLEKHFLKKDNNSKMGNGIYLKITGYVDLAVLIIFKHNLYPL
jgi:hypothetical protein